MKGAAQRSLWRGAVKAAQRGAAGRGRRCRPCYGGRPGPGSRPKTRRRRNARWGGDHGERAFGVSLLSFGTDAEERRLAPLSVAQKDVDGVVSVALDQVRGGGLEGDEAPVGRDRGNAAVEATRLDSLIRVVTPFFRSRTKTSSGCPFSSPGTRFEAQDVKATKRPLGEIEG